MIQKITIKFFKSLLDVVLDLGKVNVFVGANGSGKSNLLEAIGVLGAAANGRVDDESLKYRGVRPGLPALYKSSFRGSPGRPSLRLEASNGEANYEVELNNPIKDPSPAWRFVTEIVEERDVRLLGRSHRSKKKLDPHRGLAALKAVEWEPQQAASQLLKDLATYCIYSPNTNALRSLTTDPQHREPVGLAGGRLPEAVLELLQQTKHDERTAFAKDRIMELIDWAASFGSRSTGDDLPLSPSVAAAKRVIFFKDKFMTDNRNQLTGYDASEGALYVLFAAVLCLLPDAPPILAIDDVDHALNPRLARALMASICEWIINAPTEKQILLTSHNPLILDGLPLDNDDVRLFAVNRSRKGQTVVNRVVVDTEDLQKEGQIWTVSRLWVMGHLGGMPDV